MKNNAHRNLAGGLIHFFRSLAYVITILVNIPTLSHADEALWINFPLGRTAYQTNEWIDIDIVRPGGEQGILSLTILGDDGDKATFDFLVQSRKGVTTEHLHLNGFLLRPGNYTVQANGDGSLASKRFELYSHIRQSSFKTVSWGSWADGQQLESMGERGMGFNVVLGEKFRKNNLPTNAEYAIRGGLDFMQACTMGGAHQMDNRTECDWSDPYVLGGGIARGSRQALMTRTFPNGIGVHLYDEPGLTWWKHPDTGEWTPHNIPSQDRTYQAAFNREAIPYCEVKSDDAGHIARWEHLGTWKLSFLEASCKLSSFSNSYVCPDLFTITQSSYGWYAFADGYSFNVTRGTPLISGHGGYDDMAGGYFSPSFFYEFSRVRDMSRPNWYLPMWYLETLPEAFRLEQYLTFMMNAQGLMTSPLIQIYTPEIIPAAEAVVESNKVMSRLGTIFEHMPVRRPEVGVLYSLNNEMRRQTQDMTHTTCDVARFLKVYLATKLAHLNFQPIADEDVMDGTLAHTCRALIMTGIHYLPENQINVLEAFIQSGGVILLTDDCNVEIEGAHNIGPVDLSLEQQIQEIMANDKLDSQVKIAEKAKLDTTGNYLKTSMELAGILAKNLAQAGIKPPFDCDRPEVVISKQGGGDIDYYFLVNASYDYDKKEKHSLRPVDVRVKFPVGTYYDAVLGGSADLIPAGEGMENKLRMGAGAMKVFARTSTPIKGIQIYKPEVQRDYTLEKEPIRLILTAMLLGDDLKVLDGCAPLRITVVDSLGNIRYDLYRATNRGILQLELPLAANDPSGIWKVTVMDLLAGTQGQETFDLSNPGYCGALAGRTQRAMYFGADRDNIFRFFRLHKHIKVVPGSSEFNHAALDRLESILKPWQVSIEVIPLETAMKSRSITKEEATTWCGLEYTAPNTIKPGNENPPNLSGFALSGPVILLGNPEDNPLIKFMDDYGYLPYKPAKDVLPGNGRGLMAWQMDAVGYYNQESITLIAYDETGLSEAIGSMYEAAIGMDPLTKWELPNSSRIEAAEKTVLIPQPKVVWDIVAPDRVHDLIIEGDKISAICFDGSIITMDSRGKILAQNNYTVSMSSKEPSISPLYVEIVKKTGITTALPKYAVGWKELTAVAFWGGQLKIVDQNGNICMSRTFANDIGALAVMKDYLIVGTADCRVYALEI